jgi:hypothetical protein
LLASTHLHTYINSPALALPSRDLLAKIVRSIPPTDPPLGSDIITIHSLARLRLKASQQGFYIESILQLIKRFPSSTVGRIIFYVALNNELTALMNPSAFDKKGVKDGNASSFDMQVITLVFSNLPAKVAHEALATAYLLIASESTIHPDVGYGIIDQASHAYTDSETSPLLQTGFDALQLTPRIEALLHTLLRKTVGCLTTHFSLVPFVASLLKPFTPHIPSLSDVSILDRVARLVFVASVAVEGAAPGNADISSKFKKSKPTLNRSTSNGSSTGPSSGSGTAQKTPPLTPSSNYPTINSPNGTPVQAMTPFSLDRSSSASPNTNAASRLLQIRKLSMKWLTEVYLPALVAEGRERECGHDVDSDSDDDASDVEEEIIATTSSKPPATPAGTSNTKPRAMSPPQLPAVLPAAHYSAQMDSVFGAGTTKYFSLLIPPLVQQNQLVKQKPNLSATPPLLPSDAATSPLDSSATSKLEIMTRVLLFLEYSPTFMSKFFPIPITAEQQQRVSSLSRAPRDVDDELLSMLFLSSKAMKQTTTSYPNVITIRLMEALVSACTPRSRNTLTVSSTFLVTNLQKLCTYEVPAALSSNQFFEDEKDPDESDSDSDSSDDEDEFMLYDDPTQQTAAEKLKELEKEQARQSKFVLPTLYHPSLFWRVNSLILCLATSNPASVGKQVWETNATVRSLMKMAASSDMQYPPVSESDELAAQMAKREREVREEEFSIVSRLFMPANLRKQIRELNSEISQLDKEEQSQLNGTTERKQTLIKKQFEARRAEIETKRADLQKEIINALRPEGKSITLGGGYKGSDHARKPRNNASALISSILLQFGISEQLRSSVQPDFLMMTLGQPTREGIGQSYKWLLPIISSSPHIVNRLSPTVSCFLLLKAFQENSLVDLVGGLVNHVCKCLLGEYGEESGLHAARLLLEDVSCRDAEKRNVARRVLQECLGGHEYEAAACNIGWLIVCRDIWKGHADFVRCVVNCLEKGLEVETGAVLKWMVEGLRFEEWEINEVVFGRCICKLVADRMEACQALISHGCGDLLSGAVLSLLETEMRDSQELNGAAVTLSGKLVSSSTLRAAVVVVGKGAGGDAAEKLCGHLFPKNAAEATMADGSLALNVNSWIMIAAGKGGSERMACSSCPRKFLAPLLMCSGLSKDCFLVLLERLGSSSDDWEQLLEEDEDGWDYWGIESGLDVRKASLCKQVTTYGRIHSVDVSAPAFSEWLGCGMKETKNVAADNKDDVAGQKEIEKLIAEAKKAIEARGEEKIQQARETEVVTTVTLVTPMVIDRDESPAVDVNKAFVKECVVKDDLRRLAVAVKAHFNESFRAMTGFDKSRRVSAAVSCSEVASHLLSVVGEKLSSGKHDGDDPCLVLVRKLVPSLLATGRVEQDVLELVFKDARWTDIAMSMPYEIVSKHLVERDKLRRSSASPDVSFFYDPVLSSSYLSEKYKSVNQFEDAKAFTEIAINAAKAEGGSATAGKGAEMLLKLAGDNANCCKLVTDSLLALIPGELGGWVKEFLLRMYCLLVDKLVLSDQLRRALFAAANSHWDSFVSMECILDARIEASLEGLKSHEFGNASVAAILEVGKMHPLLTMRKLSVIRDLLIKDGAASASGKRGGAGEYAQVSGSVRSGADGKGGVAKIFVGEEEGEFLESVVKEAQRRDRERENEGRRKRSSIRRMAVGGGMSSSVGRVAFVLPAGWSVEGRPRKDESDHIDKYYTHDRSGLVTRSTVETIGVIKIMERDSCSAHIAYKRHKMEKKQERQSAANREGEGEGEGEGKKIEGGQAAAAGGGGADGSSVYWKRTGDGETKKRERRMFDVVNVQVEIKHWGCCYCLNVWTSAATILLHLPKEVLFGMGGGRVGGDVLRLFIKMCYVQVKILGRDKSEGVVAGLCQPLGILLERWRKVSAGDVDRWLAGRIEGIEEVGSCRTLLMEMGVVTGTEGREDWVDDEWVDEEKEKKKKEAEAAEGEDEKERAAKKSRKEKKKEAKTGGRGGKKGGGGSKKRSRPKEDNDDDDDEGKGVSGVYVPRATTSRSGRSIKPAR